MATVTLRLNEQEEKLFRDYANFTGRKLSDLFKSALAEQIEDLLDLRAAQEALEEFERNTATFSIDDVIKELENDV